MAETKIGKSESVGNRVVDSPGTFPRRCSTPRFAPLSHSQSWGAAGRRSDAIDAARPFRATPLDIACGFFFGGCAGFGAPLRGRPDSLEPRFTKVTTRRPSLISDRPRPAGSQDNQTVSFSCVDALSPERRFRELVDTLPRQRDAGTPQDGSGCSSAWRRSIISTVMSGRRAHRAGPQFRDPG